VVKPSGTISDVGHIVVLMQENRSFDHYFGTMKGVRGFGDPFPIPGNVWYQRSTEGGAAHVLPFHLDTQKSFAHMRVEGTPHTWPDAQQAWNLGRIDAWPSHKNNHSMGYYTEADIPFQYALANTFTICDAYHSSLQAGTNPNRVYAWTCSVDPFQQGGGPVTGNLYDNLDYDPDGGYTWTTYAERLQAAGVSWQVYQDMDDNYTNNPLAGFRAFRDAYAGRANADPQLRKRGLASRSLEQLKRDVEGDTLPQVSFIVATAEGSEHPLPSSPAQGAQYTVSVLKALTANPAVWNKTVLLLMFDENDGFFDHVPPPAVPSDSDSGASTVSTEGEYHQFNSGEEGELPELMGRPYGLGPRVPMTVMSPWSRGGWVNSQVFDHSSVIRFIEQRFGVAEPNITPWRRAVCGDLTSAFDFTKPDYAPFMHLLPDPSALAERARQLGGTTLPTALPAVEPPAQANGSRPSRALPYELHVHERIVGGVIELRFANTGKAAAVFHVYDKNHLEKLPRRFTVEAGKELSGTWTSGDSYDLWVLGPNGFHRHVCGRYGSVNKPAVQLDYGVAEGSIIATLGNHGSTELTLTISADIFVIAPGAVLKHSWPIAVAGNWYDIIVRLQGDPGYLRRFAGRMETGKDSISDPMMGTKNNQGGTNGI
jgi:phospholipase C